VVACSAGPSAAPATTATTVGPSTTTTTTTTAALPSTTTTTTPQQAVAAGVCPELPPMATPDPDRPVYTVRANARPAEGVVDGDLTVRFTPDLATDRLIFRLWPNGPRPADAGVRLDAGPVTSGGQALISTQPDPTTLQVVLAAPLAPGQSVEVSMPWRLAVPGSVSDRTSHSGDTLRLGSFLPTLAWEPGVGWATEPPTAAFAEAATSPAADYDVALTASPGYDVLASGQRGADGHWRLTAGRDFAASIGHFQVASATVAAPAPVEVTVGVAADVGESPQTYLDRVAEALGSFASRFGAYPWPTLTVALTPDLVGGIEFPTHIMLGPDTIGRTTPHEVAHMWFYSLVGNDQARDPWLDEGITSYAEFTHEGTAGANRGASISSSAAGHAGEPMTYWETRQGSYYRGVYVQAANAVDALGDATNIGFVDCALAHYVARNAYRIARPADFFASVSIVFPDAAATMAPFGLHP
jgi:hypothetical protein